MLLVSLGLKRMMLDWLAEFSPDKLTGMGETVRDILAQPEKSSAQIAALKAETLYNLEKSSRAAGKYLLSRIREIKEKKREDK